jgi:hypothetical protein
LSDAKYYDIDFQATIPICRHVAANIIRKMPKNPIKLSAYLNSNSPKKRAE